MTNRNLWIILGVTVILGLIFLKGEPREKIDPNSPLLSGFEDTKTWGISPEKGFSIKLNKKYKTQGTYALEVFFPEDDMPSINTKRLKQNWGGYDYLALDVYNPQKESIKLKIRLDDADRKIINIPYKIEPGPNKIQIPRDKIESKIDAGNIRFVVLFIDGPDKRYRLYFDNLRLERSNLIAGVENLKADKTNGGMVALETSQPPGGRKAVVFPPKPAVTKGELKVTVAKLKEAKDGVSLISAGVPFAPGQLKSDKELMFLDKEGNEIPIATKILAKWPQDRSIRSVLVQFKFSIEHLYDAVTMKWGEGRKGSDLKITEPIWDYPEGYIVLPSQWLCDSLVIGDQVPMTRSVYGGYEKNIDTFFDSIADRPWTGNLREDGYYSSPHTYYQLYVRSSEVKYFLAARKELLHYRDTQIIKEGEDKGRSTTGSETRYVYVEAMADDYFLTGDPRSFEIAKDMVDYQVKTTPPEKAFFPKKASNFWTERLIAFPFLGAVTYYEMTQDKHYLNLADEYMKQLHRTQMEWPQRGGFIHNLYSHDPEEGARKDEYGGSPFMAGLLLEPIVKYHQLTGSEIASDSIFRALDWLIKEGLVESKDAFKYMTADAYEDSGGDPDVNLLIVHALGYGFKISGYTNYEYLDIGMRVFERGVKDAFLKNSKHFNQNYRSSSHFLAYIQGGIQQSQGQRYEAMKKQVAAAAEQTDYAFENFNDSVGDFSAPNDTLVNTDKTNVYQEGNTLQVKATASPSNLSAEIALDSWSVEDYPVISFAYRIPEATPVGMRVQTEFGDWVCIGGTKAYQCDGKPSALSFSLIDDDQWHRVDISAKDSIREVLAQVKRLKAFQFFTAGNAQKNNEFWIDDFQIHR